MANLERILQRLIFSGINHTWIHSYSFKTSLIRCHGGRHTNGYALSSPINHAMSGKRFDSRRNWLISGVVVLKSYLLIWSSPRALRSPVLPLRILRRVLKLCLYIDAFHGVTLIDDHVIVFCLLKLNDLFSTSLPI